MPPYSLYTIRRRHLWQSRTGYRGSKGVGRRYKTRRLNRSFGSKKYGRVFKRGGRRKGYGSFKGLGRRATKKSRARQKTRYDLPPIVTNYKILKYRNFTTITDVSPSNTSAGKFTIDLNYRDLINIDQRATLVANWKRQQIRSIKVSLKMKDTRLIREYAQTTTSGNTTAFDNTTQARFNASIFAFWDVEGLALDFPATFPPASINQWAELPKVKRLTTRNKVFLNWRRTMRAMDLYWANTAPANSAGEQGKTIVNWMWNNEVGVGGNITGGKYSPWMPGTIYFYWPDYNEWSSTSSHIQIEMTIESTWAVRTNTRFEDSVFVQEQSGGGGIKKVSKLGKRKIDELEDDFSDIESVCSDSTVLVSNKRKCKALKDLNFK